MPAAATGAKEGGARDTEELSMQGGAAAAAAAVVAAAAAAVAVTDVSQSVHRYTKVLVSWLRGERGTRLRGGAGDLHAHTCRRRCSRNNNLICFPAERTDFYFDKIVQKKLFDQNMNYSKT